ncbi:hypothetical protein CBM2637_B120169 [Cupriavidus taiwanensis]|nr:hypothetical protein CBM2637_B120169 [Cupriavidus taiwanensis]
MTEPEAGGLLLARQGPGKLHADVLSHAPRARAADRRRPGTGADAARIPGARPLHRHAGAHPRAGRDPAGPQ